MHRRNHHGGRPRRCRVRHRYTEISSNLFRGPGRWTAGFRIRGTVTDLAGERHHVLVVHSQLGPDALQDLVTKINVN
jgi:hypothetical protein